MQRQSETTNREAGGELAGYINHGDGSDPGSRKLHSLVPFNPSTV
jgi:hypothetical protein